MYRIFPMTAISRKLLIKRGYKLDPTHTYYYKKVNDDVEIQIQNIRNDLYLEGQVIIYCQNATIIDDLYEIKIILQMCTKE